MKKKGIRTYTAVSAVLFLIIFTISSSLAVFAIDDDAYDGYAADSLTIKVGYAGGPYYEKKVFTLEEIESMPAVTADYTFIDNMPSVVIDHAKGVRLQDLMDEAGIDMNSIENFYFYTVDKTEGYFTTYPKTELIDTQRYCYYSLPDNFDSETGVGNADSTAIAEPVDTIISYADDWNRVIEGAEFGSDFENLNTATRFRLIFGQVDSSTRTASRSAKWIHEIDVQLGGRPSLTVSGETNLDLKVGSQKKLEVGIKNADSAIQTDTSSITWTSSDESVAVVDAEGNVTVVGEGSATITADMNGSTVSFTVNGSGEQEEEETSDPEQNDEPNANDQQEETQQKEVTASTATGSGNSSGSGSTGSSGGSSASSSGSGSKSASAGTTTQKKNNEDQQKNQNAMSGVTLDDSGDGSASSSGTLDTAQTAESQDGGVQNWRVYEMSEDAEEMPEIEEDNPLLGFTKKFLGLIFAGGGGTKLALFSMQTGSRRRKRGLHRLYHLLKK